MFYLPAIELDLSCAAHCIIQMQWLWLSLLLHHRLWRCFEESIRNLNSLFNILVSKKIWKFISTITPILTNLGQYLLRYIQNTFLSTQRCSQGGFGDQNLYFFEKFIQFVWIFCEKDPKTPSKNFRLCPWIPIWQITI